MQQKLEVYVMCCRGVKGGGFFDKADPYVKIRYGSQQQKTHTDKDAGKNPNWNETLWFTVAATPYILEIEVWDKDVGKDDFMGKTLVDFTPAKDKGSLSGAFPLRNKHGSNNGDIHLKITCHGAPTPYPAYPATAPAPPPPAPAPAPAPSYPQPTYAQPDHSSGPSKLDVQVVSCRGVKGGGFETADPYVKLIYAGQRQRTRTDANAGKNSNFNQTLTLDVHQQPYTLEVEVWDHDVSNKDDFMARGMVDFKAAIDRGYLTGSFPLYNKHGQCVPAWPCQESTIPNGEVQLNITYRGKPAGGSYPTAHPQAPSPYPPPYGQQPAYGHPPAAAAQYGNAPYGHPPAPAPAPYSQPPPPAPYGQAPPGSYPPAYGHPPAPGAYPPPAPGAYPPAPGAYPPAPGAYPPAPAHTPAAGYHQAPPPAGPYAQPPPYAQPGSYPPAPAAPHGQPPGYGY